MSQRKITISGATLSLLQVGESGTIAKISHRHTDNSHAQNGLAIGTSLTMMQQVPCCAIQVGETTVMLDAKMARAIYVRLDPPTGSAARKNDRPATKRSVNPRQPSHPKP